MSSASNFSFSVFSQAQFQLWVQSRHPINQKHWFHCRTPMWQRFRGFLGILRRASMLQGQGWIPGVHSFPDSCTGVRGQWFDKDEVTVRVEVSYRLYHFHTHHPVQNRAEGTTVPSLPNPPIPLRCCILMNPFLIYCREDRKRISKLHKWIQLRSIRRHTQTHMIVEKQNLTKLVIELTVCQYLLWKWALTHGIHKQFSKGQCRTKKFRF